MKTLLITCLLCGVSFALFAQNSMLYVNNLRLSIKSGDTLSVNGNILIDGSTVSDENIDNRGVIIWNDGGSDTTNFLLNKGIKTPVFYSSSNPYIFYDDKNKEPEWEDKTYGRLIVRGSKTKLIETSSGGYFFNNIDLYNRVRLNTTIKSFGAIDFRGGKLNLNGGNLLLYDLDDMINRKGGFLLNEDSISNIVDSQKSGKVETIKLNDDKNNGNIGLKFLDFSDSRYSGAKVSRVHNQFPGVTNGSIFKYYNLELLASSGMQGQVSANYFVSDFNSSIGNRSTMGVFYKRDDSFEILKTERVTATSVLASSGNNLDNGTYTIADTVCINPPVINFTKDNYEICAGGSVQIECRNVTRNNVEVLPVSYHWSQSGSTTSTLNLENLTESKTVSLRIVTSDGCRVSKSVEIKVNPNPESKIEIQNLKIGYCEGDSVIIIDTKEHSGGTYIWSPANAKYTGKEYHYSSGPITSNTSIPISLEYLDENGCSASSSVNVVFIPKPKVAFAFSDSSICMEKELEIINNTVNDGISKYTWYLGNGDSIEVTKDGVKIYALTPVDTSKASKIILGALAPNINLKYYNSGIYNLGLKAFTREGCSAGATRTAIVYPSVKAEVKFITNDTICLNNKISFCAKDTAGATFITKYHWTLYNSTNSSTPIQEFFKDNYNDTIQYIFTSPGVKKIGLEVFSKEGCSNISFVNIYVAPRPEASFKAQSVCFGNSSLITNSSSANTGEKYYWTLGSAAIVKTDTLAFKHPFDTQGKNNVLLEVVNKYGCSDTISHEVTLWPKPKAIMETRNACLNAQDADTLIVNHSKDIKSSYWLFGDGTNSEVYQPLKKYNDAKTYHVLLRVENEYGCTAQVNDSVVIYNVVNPSISVNNACSGNTSVFSGPAGAAKYKWEYGDGISAETFASISTYKYKKAGTYTAHLVLTTSHNCVSEISKTVNVYTGPAASFKAIPVCIGEATGFELSDSTSLNQDCTYFWNFGDNSTSNQKNTSHTYIAKGAYNVTLTVISKNSCVGEASGVALVDSVPEAHFGEVEGTCNDQLVLSAKNPNCTYLWNDNSQAETLTVNNSGNYSVTIVNSLTGCRATYSTEVKLKSKIYPQLIDQTACGNAVVKTPIFGADYLWSTGATNQSINIDEIGVHTVSLIVTKDGCSGYDTATISVRPVPEFDLGTSKNICFGDQLELSVNPEMGNTKSFEWSSSDPSFKGLGASKVLIKNSSEQLVTHHYVASVITNDNCKASDNIDITLRPRIPLNLGTDESLCVGQSLLMDATIPDAADYIWNDNYISPSRTIVTELNGDLPVNNIWWVKATDIFGCSVYDSVEVSVNPYPLISLDASYNKCNGDTLLIDATQKNISQYLWEPMTAKSPILKLFNDSSDESSSQNIRLELTNIYGCTSSSKWIEVKFKEAPQKALPKEITACNLALLNAGNPGATFSWNNDQSTQYQYVRESGNYKVKITNSENCSLTDSVQVKILTVIKPNLGGYRSVCSNAELELTTGINNPDYSFLWNNNAVTPTLKVSTSGKYWIRVNHTNGCVESDTVVVESKAAPSVNLGSDVDLCSDEYFPITTNAKGSYYYWGSTNPGYEKVTTKGYIEVNQVGTYWVRVLTSDGCEASDTVQVTPTSNPIYASFLAVSKFKTGDSIQFLDMSYPNPVKWFWDLGDMRVSQDQDPLHVYYTCDTFQVILNVSNGVCQSILAKDVIVSGCTKSGKFEYKERENKFIKIVSSSLFPNPTVGNLNLEVELSGQSDLHIFIFSLMGTLEKSDVIHDSQLISKEYNISSLKPGIYLVKIIAGGDQKTYKIIKI